MESHPFNPIFLISFFILLSSFSSISPVQYTQAGVYREIDWEGKYEKLENTTVESGSIQFCTSCWWNNSWDNGANDYFPILDPSFEPGPAPRDIHLIAHEGHIYGAGGWNAMGDPFNIRGKDLYDYDLDTRTMSILEGSIHTRAKNIMLAAQGDEIFMFGGLDVDDELITDTSIYNLTTQSWSAGEDLPHGAAGAITGIYENQVYLAASVEYPDPSDDILIYNISENTWDNMSLPFGLALPAGGIVGDKLYIHAGINDVFFYLNKTLVFNLTDETHHNISDSQYNFSHSRASVSGSDIYVLGGYYALTSTNIFDVFRFNTTDEKWDILGKMNSGRQGHGIAIWNDSLYLMGGSIQNEGYGGFQPSHSLEEFNLSTGKWDFPTLPRSFREHMSLLVDDDLYLFSGSIQQGLAPLPTNDTFVFNITSGESHMLNGSREDHPRGIAVENNGTIYVSGHIESIIEAYNITTDTWTTVNDTATSRLEYGAIHNGTIYYFYNETIWAFNVDNLSWWNTSVSNDIHGYATTLNEWIYVITKDEFLRYRPSDNSLEDLTPLPGNGLGTQLIAWDDYIVATRGNGGPEVYIYSPQDNDWWLIGQLNYGREYPSLAVNNNTIIVSGGQLIDSQAQYLVNTVEYLHVSQPARKAGWGNFTSELLDLGGPAVLGSLDWSYESNDLGTESRMRFRAGGTSEDLNASVFSGPTGLESEYYLSPGELWEGLGNVTHIQYEVNMTTRHPFQTGQVTEVEIFYDTLPQLEFTHPSIDVIVDNDINLTWIHDDPDSMENITLIYAPRNFSQDETVMAVLSEVNSSYVWNTTFVRNGEYLIKAIIEDENSSVTSIASGNVTIYHPEILESYSISSRVINPDIPVSVTVELNDNYDPDYQGYVLLELATELNISYNFTEFVPSSPHITILGSSKEMDSGDGGKIIFFNFTLDWNLLDEGIFLNPLPFLVSYNHSLAYQEYLHDFTGWEVSPHLTLYNDELLDITGPITGVVSDDSILAAGDEVRISGNLLFTSSGQTPTNLNLYLNGNSMNVSSTLR